MIGCAKNFTFSILCVVSSFKSAPNHEAQRFANSLVDALKEMRQICVSSADEAFASTGCCDKKAAAAVGTIFTDSIYTPIKNVKYSVENFRVEQKTDYEKLIFEIQTDGSINPQDALTQAAKILIHHFMLFSDERITLEADEIAQTETYDEESLHMRQLLKTKLIDMDLSVRALNCLKAAEVDTLGDLVSFNKNDLMKFRNFGKKSLTELEELVNVKGLSFGMDLSKYKLDKD